MEARLAKLSLGFPSTLQTVPSQSVQNGLFSSAFCLLFKVLPSAHLSSSSTLSPQVMQLLPESAK